MSTLATAPGAPPERDLDLRYYADLLWRGRAIVATTAVVGLSLGWLIASLQTPEYRAGAMVQIEPPTPVFMSVSDALMGGGGFWQNADFYNTQFQILRSRALGDRVVTRLKLDTRPPFQDVADKGAIFMSHVSIEPVPESRLAVIQVTHPDPKEAALWANALADVYIEQTLETRLDAARRAYDWLQERLAATQKSMRDAQDRLFKSYQTQDLFVPEGSVSALSSSIGKLQEDYIEAQSRRIALEAALNQVAEMRRKGESLDSVPQVAADAMVLGFNTQLANLGLELSRLKEKFKQAHPEVQKVQAQLDQVRTAKDARAAQLVEGMRAEYGQLQRRETELRAAIEAQKGQAASQSRKASELEALKKEADSAKSLYEALLQKLNETDIASSVRSNNVSLVERAAPPGAPVRPNKRRILGMALLLGVLAGVGLVLGRDYLGNTIKSPEDVERYLHLDLLAAVPRYDDDTAHLVTEAYQGLRTALIFARKEESGQVVLVTGTAPQEGKTTTLVNIGRLLAASGERTLLVDFDLRRAQLHHRMGVTREPGVTDLFVKHEELASLVRPTSSAGLFVLTAGPLPPNPPALLARKNLETLLADLRSQFEWILVDSPPLASVTDALLLARHADISVVVIRHNKVDRKLVKRSVAALRKVTGSLLGVVLNAVDVKAQGYYYYYYQHGDQPQAPPATKPASTAAAL
jgi:capsular exopolysaccharide synthesis family protein